MRLGIATFIAGLVLGWCWSLQPVAACSIAEPVPFTIDPALADVDVTPPTPFRDVQVVLRQVSGTRCEGNICTSSSCGDFGVVELTFTPPHDVSDVGYRVIWHGTGGANWADGIVPLDHANTIDLPAGFDEVTQLDGELSLVAVDRAGNESQPSAPVQVSWSGCMSYFDAPERCAQHTESCTIATPGVRQTRLPLLLMAAGLAGLACCRRWRRVGRRRRV